eukprot:CAMPEP_0176401490 /NCGR_PEP_ID=MMETSP0126-20121128/48474_1 /TAXON_ID=141414 ORGANISM="Strombidinopsis acuminatum, Strain SPMC142" /NCGR_SAMPLE_ID=MMETSP0126 /ASSEMBLY_ACC=CAM_ASM_000229 /LENGTH=83 /DNA_ID=CAMNT_0017778447 /DNA_START=1182 /DNA_END=1433 /DNA_ORIENTATION=-
MKCSVNKKDNHIPEKFTSPNARSNMLSIHGDMSALTAPSSRYLNNLEGDVWADSFYTSENDESNQIENTNALLFDDQLYAKEA